MPKTTALTITELGTTSHTFPALRRGSCANAARLPYNASGRGTFAARLVAVQPVGAKRRQTNPDISFQCEHCQAQLVASRSAAGLKLNCRQCGKPTLVPQPAPTAGSDVPEADEIQRKLKENESQRAEVTGYINQLSIQLHRWQLRMQTLDERKAQLEKDQRDQIS